MGMRNLFYAPVYHPSYLGAGIGTESLLWLCMLMEKVPLRNQIHCLGMLPGMLGCYMLRKKGLLGLEVTIKEKMLLLYLNMVTYICYIGDCRLKFCIEIFSDFLNFEILLALYTFFLMGFFNVIILNFLCLIFFYLILIIFFLRILLWKKNIKNS